MEEQNYEVKNVKTFQGMEGTGFNASLYRNGKKVALVIDDAHGGDFQFQWDDWREQRVDINITLRDGKPHTFKGTPEEKVLYEYVDKLPLEKNKYFPDGMKQTPDTFVEDLVTKYESDTWMRRQLKKNFMTQIGDKIGSDEFLPFKKKPGVTKESVEKYIKKNYPGQKYKIWE